MSAINPFSGYVAQGAAVERSQAADKARQLRRQQAVSKDAALRGDQLEHQVESADAISPAGDEPPKEQPRRQPGGRQTDKDEDGPTLDLRA